MANQIRPLLQPVTVSPVNNMRLPGQWFQVEDGLAYNWHRTYDPSLGRYTQADPLGFVDGPGIYNYAGGSPLMGVDRKGLETTIIVWDGGLTGSHAGIYISDPHGLCGGQAIYVPGGGFPSIGGGRLLLGAEVPPMSKYLQPNLGGQCGCETFTFPTTPEEEVQIIENADDLGGAMGGLCAAAVQTVISGVGPFKKIPGIFFRTPYGLAGDLRKLSPRGD